MDKRGFSWEHGEDFAPSFKAGYRAMGHADGDFGLDFVLGLTLSEGFRESLAKALETLDSGMRGPASGPAARNAAPASEAPAPGDVTGKEEAGKPEAGRPEESKRGILSLFGGFLSPFRAKPGKSSLSGRTLLIPLAVLAVVALAFLVRLSDGPPELSAAKTQEPVTAVPIPAQQASQGSLKGPGPQPGRQSGPQPGLEANAQPSQEPSMPVSVGPPNPPVVLQGKSGGIAVEAVPYFPLAPGSDPSGISPRTAAELVALGPRFTPEAGGAVGGNAGKGRAGQGKGNGKNDPRQVVRTVARVPGEGLPQDDPVADPASENPSLLAEELEPEDDFYSEEAFGGGEPGFLGYGPDGLMPAPSAGETGPRPGDGPDGGFEPAFGPVDPDGPKVVKVIGYTSGSPLDKEILAGFLGQERLSGLESGFLELQEPSNGEILHLRTTFDRGLQAEAQKWVRAVGSLEAALVVLDPEDGKVLAMAGAGSGTKLNPAVAGSFPAASVFKLITAAAAMERNGYDEDSYVLYDGGRHTLYKSNVVKDPDVGRHKATFKESFAHSINSVFGKLGIYTLGAEELKAYAESFRFNSPILFEMEVTPSSFLVEDAEDPFLLAELASGYNRTTKASPLHAAMMVAAVHNGGRVMEPYFVEEVADNRNNVLYTGTPKELGKVMADGTASSLWTLMKATVYEGTGRKRFYDATSHPVLRRLDLGGKSGTINDTEGNYVDWFVALAKLKDAEGKESKPLAIAAVVVHNGRARLSSQELVRRAVISYYKDKP